MGTRHLAIVSVGLCLSFEAAAQDQVVACPPGAYCEESQVEPIDEPTDEPAEEPGEPSGRTVVIPPPPAGTDPSAPRIIVVHPDTDQGPGQVTVYEPGTAPPRFGGYEPLPPPPEHRQRWRRDRRWGLALRAEGVLMPQYRDDIDAGMGGVGLELKYRPVPGFALGLGADFIGGVDGNGYDRQEIPLAVSAYVYPNPHNLAQFYLFGGLDWAFARVESDEVQPNLAEDGIADHYTYFGGHVGLGLEFRVSRLVGINVDGLAFVRTRTDDDGEGRYPEFYDAEENEGSNTAAAGLLRGGVTFWW